MARRPSDVEGNTIHRWFPMPPRGERVVAAARDDQAALMRTLSSRRG